MFIIDGMKSRAHREVVANPTAHGWVLNLYLNGERYPERVCDYFQSEYAPTQELAENIVRHASDEQRHVRLYSHALSTIGEPVVDLAPPFVFNEVVRSFTPDTFHILPTDGEDAQREKLANFLAHAHFLEKRVGRSIEYHADACGALGRDHAGKCVAAVMRDEERHVEYTREAVLDLLPRRKAQEVLDTHRRAEAKANLEFSLRLLRNFLNRYDNGISTQRKLMFRVCEFIMQGASRLV
ncbi:MAG: hypothetical protein KDA86_24645 [Planctomycetaceae bacterium]|nr:hypothetical protein [Planctomycetaceae bacterium]